MQENTLYQIFDTVSEMVLVVARETRVVRYANRAAQQVAGLHPGDTLDRDPWSFLYDQNLTDHLGQIPLPSGADIPVAITLRAAERETTPSVICVLRDLRAPDIEVGQVKSKPSKSDSPAPDPAGTSPEYRYHLLLDAAPDFVFFISREGVMLHPRMTGELDQEDPIELAGMQSLDTMVVPEIARQLESMVEKALRAQKILSTVLDLRTDGIPSSFDVRVIPNSPETALALVRDITEHRQTIAALSESEQRYRGLVESQRDLIVRVDTEGRFTFVNDAYCKKFGKTCDELLNNPYMPLVHEDDLPDTLREMERLKTPPYRTYVEQRALTAEGWRWLAWEDYAIHDDDGHITEIQAVGRDITEAKRTQEALVYQGRLFQGVSDATRRLLEPGDYQAALADALRIAGEVIQADFIYLYENRTDPETGEPVASLLCHWINETIRQDEDFALPSDLPWIHHGQPTGFYENFRAGKGLRRMFSEFPASERPVTGQIGFQSGMAEPVMIDQEFWGLLAAYARYDARVWTDAEVLATRTLATSIATGIARMRKENDLRVARTYSDTLREAGLALTASLQPDTVLETVLQQARNVIPLDSAYVLLVEGNQARVRHAIGFESLGVPLSQLRQDAFDIHDTQLLHRLIEARHPIAISTVRRESKSSFHPDTWKVGSWMGAPILSGDRLAGFFVVESLTPGVYNEEHCRLIEPFVTHAALALQNAQLFDQLVDQTYELTTTLANMKSVYAAAHAILSTLDLNESLNRLLDSIASVIRFDAANVVLIDGDTMHFEIRRGYSEQGFSPEELNVVELALRSMPHMHTIIQTGQALVIPDVDQDDGWVRIPQTMWIRSWMGAPIKLRGQVVGIFSLDSAQTGFYGPEHVELVEIFAGLASVAFENAQLYRQVENRLSQIIGLYSASQSILSSLDLDTILNRLARQMTSVTSATSTIICDYDPETQSGTIQASYANPDVPVREAMRSRGDRVQLKSRWIQQIILGNSGIRLSDRKLRDAFPDSDLVDHVEQAILVPLASRGRTTGFALVRDSQPASGRTSDMRLMVDALANQAAIALQQAFLFDEIQRLEQVKSDMLRIASHDLRTPLQRIKSAVEMLQELLPAILVESHQDYFNFALSGVDQVEAIINEILSLRRVEERYRKPEPILWCDVIEQAIGLVRIEADAKQQTLSVDCPDDLLAGQGDPVQLARALVNLLNNAVKYTPEGGEIAIRAYETEVDGRTMVSVEVEDTGMGIPAHLQANIFEPFYRAVQPGTEEIPGIGLGLTVVKAAIEYHKGSVFFNSTPGKGSCFGFRIPV